jgi:hypothetical protein
MAQAVLTEYDIISGQAFVYGVQQPSQNCGMIL